MSRTSIALKYIDPSEDVEVIKRTLALARQGEIAFLREIATASMLLIPKRPEDIVDWIQKNCFIPANKGRGGLARLSLIQRETAKLVLRFGVEMVILLKCPRLSQDPDSGNLFIEFSDATIIGPIVLPSKVLNPRGNWSAGAPDNAGDAYRFEGGTYVVKVAHISTTVAAAVANNLVGLLTRDGADG